MIISYQEIFPFFPPFLVAKNLDAIAFFEWVPGMQSTLTSVAEVAANLYEEPCVVVEPFKRGLTIYQAPISLIEDEESEVFELSRSCATTYQEKYHQGVVPLYFVQPYYPAILGIMDTFIPIRNYHKSQVEND